MGNIRCQEEVIIIMIILAAVTRDVSRVVDVGSDLGLELNVSKCELIAHDSLTLTDSFLHHITSHGEDGCRPQWPLYPRNIYLYTTLLLHK